MIALRRACVVAVLAAVCSVSNVEASSAAEIARLEAKVKEEQADLAKADLEEAQAQLAAAKAGAAVETSSTAAAETSKPRASTPQNHIATEAVVDSTADDSTADAATNNTTTPEYTDGACGSCCASGATNGEFDAEEQATNNAEDPGCCYESGCCGEKQVGCGTYCMPWRTEERCCCNMNIGSRSFCRCCCNGCDDCMATVFCNKVVKWILFGVGIVAGAVSMVVIFAHAVVCCKKTAAARGAAGESGSEMLVNNSRFLANKKDEYYSKAQAAYKEGDMSHFYGKEKIAPREKTCWTHFLEFVGIDMDKMDNETKMNIAIYGMAALVLLCLLCSACARWRRLRKLRKDREEKRQQAYRAAAEKQGKIAGRANKQPPARSNDGFIQPPVDYADGEYRQPKVSYMGI